MSFVKYIQIFFFKKMREYGVQNDTNNRNSHGEEHVLNLWA